MKVQWIFYLSGADQSLFSLHQVVQANCLPNFQHPKLWKQILQWSGSSWVIARFVQQSFAPKKGLKKLRHNQDRLSSFWSKLSNQSCNKAIETPAENQPATGLLAFCADFRQLCSNLLKAAVTAWSFQHTPIRVSDCGQARVIVRQNQEFSVLKITAKTRND